jgi:hypothetical protein
VQDAFWHATAGQLLFVVQVLHPEIEVYVQAPDAHSACLQATGVQLLSVEQV